MDQPDSLRAAGMATAHSQHRSPLAASCPLVSSTGFNCLLLLLLPSETLQVPKPFGLKTTEVGLVQRSTRKAGIADGRVVVPLLCSGCTSATTGYLVTWLFLAVETLC